MPGMVDETANLDVSIVIPLLNEVESLDELHTRITTVMEATKLSFEIIFIDDGSSDGSAAALESISKADQRVNAIILKRNFGKSNALMVGFGLARGNVAVTMDADLQDLPENIPILLEQKDYGLVSGWRKHRKDSFLKKTLSGLFNGLVNLFFGVNVKDINCGFKAYKKDLYKSLLLYGDLHRMTLVLAKMEGFSFIEAPIEHAPRKHGHSKYPMFRARGIWDIMSLGMMQSMQARPFHFFAPYSVALLMIAACLFLYLLVLSMLGHGGYTLAHTLFMITTLLGVSFFLMGLQMEATQSVFMKDHQFNKTIRRIVGRNGNAGEKASR